LRLELVVGVVRVDQAADAGEVWDGHLRVGQHPVEIPDRVLCAGRALAVLRLLGREQRVVRLEGLRRTTAARRGRARGLSMFPASIDPSAAPAPTTVYSSSMNRITCRSAAVTSSMTPLSRSSTSPRYLLAATIPDRSSAITRRH
jgi:hypothetical protein